MSMDEKSIGELVQQYVELRNELATKRRYFESEEARIKGEQSEIEMLILDKANELGVESFKTNFGTAYKTEKTLVQISNWEDFSQYVVKNNAMHLVQKRVAKIATLEELDSGEIIPGVDVIKTKEIQVRK